MRVSSNVDDSWALEAGATGGWFPAVDYGNYTYYGGCTPPYAECSSIEEPLGSTHVIPSRCGSGGAKRTPLPHEPPPCYRAVVPLVAASDRITAAHRNPGPPAGTLVPREHGATAMLLLPFLSAAILARHFRWPELAALLAAWAAFTSKDPLAAIARQRFLWKKPHPETQAAIRSAIVKGILLALSASLLAFAGPLTSWLILFAGGAAFAVFAIWVQMRTRQRSAWFQVASAVALTSACLAAALAATGHIPAWCWPLWLLSALQASAAVFVVHARLDARIAARKLLPPPRTPRRTAWIAQIVLAAAAAVAALARLPWIAAALALAAVAYSFELTRQRRSESLNTRLQRIGLEALTLAVIYAALIVAGLWSFAGSAD